MPRTTPSNKFSLDDIDAIASPPLINFHLFSKPPLELRQKIGEQILGCLSPTTQLDSCIRKIKGKEVCTIQFYIVREIQLHGTLQVRHESRNLTIRHHPLRLPYMVPGDEIKVGSYDLIEINYFESVFEVLARAVNRGVAIHSAIEKIYTLAFSQWTVVLASDNSQGNFTAHCDARYKASSKSCLVQRPEEHLIG